MHWAVQRWDGFQEWFNSSSWLCCLWLSFFPSLFTAFCSGSFILRWASLWDRSCGCSPVMQLLEALALHFWARPTSSDWGRKQLHQAGCFYGAIKMYYLTHAGGEKHFTSVENYSRPGSVCLEHKGSTPLFLLPAANRSPRSPARLRSFPWWPAEGTGDPHMWPQLVCKGPSVLSRPGCKSTCCVPVDVHADMRHHPHTVDGLCMDGFVWVQASNDDRQV